MGVDGIDKADIFDEYFEDDKPIMIDGVNVAECDYFVRQRGFNCYMGKNCNETNDCYFKQLQRLKQENEELKENYQKLYKNAEQLADKYCKYDGKKENELVEVINKTTDLKNKYKQAFEEIREAIGEKYGMADIIKIRTILDEALNDRD